ncbi:MAG TPA: hypothetical protein VEB22_08665, partial [Phycisphaerales bacterium]|nr:hypothetical protein [Phycisphaerales bacterium]
GCGQRFGRVEVSPGAVPEGVTLPDAAAVVAEFGPARVAVHPLSRLEGSGESRRAVVHVQVLDAYGHDVKWPGVVSVEVAPTESFAASRVQWVDLTGGEENARVFDTISRCYTLRVPAPGTEPVYVRVRWLLADGEGRPGAFDAQSVLTPAK